MIKASYILFSLAVMLLITCLILYQNSWQKSLEYHERVNTIHTVLRLIKRLETLTHGTGVGKVYASSTDSSRSVVNEIDSLLDRLRGMVLYEEQRMRIDTLKRYFHELAIQVRRPASNVLEVDHALSSFVTTIEQLMFRAENFASDRLEEQQVNFRIQNARMNAWVNWILFSSFCLFVIGVVTTVYQNLEKRRLKIRNEATLNNAGIGICLYEATESDPGPNDFVLIYANDNAQQEYFRERIFNQNPRIVDHFKEVLSTGASRRMELSYVHRNTTGWYVVNLSRVSENSLAIYFQDITRIKSYEEDLKTKVAQLKKVNADLDQFAQATSHDLQEPFRKIRMLAELIDHNHNPQKNPKYLQSIIKSAERGHELVREVLKYSQVQSNDDDFRYVDLNNIVDGIQQDFDLLIQEKGVNISKTVLPTVKANHIQMIQLFTNLIQNSIKFASPDRPPKIEITCELVKGSELSQTSSLNQLHDYYWIRISDNGIGFEIKFRDQIFDAFRRLHSETEYPGFGLGLSLCKKIVLNHLGDITVSSSPGQGTTFNVYLPKDEHARPPGEAIK